MGNESNYSLSFTVMDDMMPTTEVTIFDLCFQCTYYSSWFLQSLVLRKSNLYFQKHWLLRVSKIILRISTPYWWIESKDLTSHCCFFCIFVNAENSCGKILWHLKICCSEWNIVVYNLNKVWGCEKQDISLRYLMALSHEET